MKVKSLMMLFVSFIVMSVFNYAAKPPADEATIKNIKAAITGESTASAKYAAYAKKAKEEGYNKIALLFEAASKSESIHAGNHRAALEQLGVTMEKVTPKFEVKSTKENLEDAVKGESYEVSTMYPNFIKTANKNKVNIALISFNYAFQTEKKHKVLYQHALQALNEGKENNLASKYMVCSTCGNTYDGEAPARCGISMTPRDRFVTIE
ncbi:MAG: rubrerythrin family protein [Bacteroidetes bacterium]|nr:rubrerythrin family protein [Bacteroidota bacterium]